MRAEWAWIGAKLVVVPEIEMKVVEYGDQSFRTYGKARNDLLHYLENPKSCADFRIAANHLRASRKATSVERSPLIWLIHEVPTGGDSKRSSYQLMLSLAPRLVEVLLPSLATSEVEEHARLGEALRVLTVEEVCAVKRCAPQQATAHTEKWSSGRLVERTDYVAKHAVCVGHGNRSCGICLAPSEWTWKDSMELRDLVDYGAYNRRLLPHPAPDPSTTIAPGTYDLSR